MQNRREFLGMSAMAAGAAIAGCTTAKPTAGVKVEAKDGDFRSVLVHLGHNMWCDWPSEFMGFEELQKLSPKKRPDMALRCKDILWRKATDHIAAKGMNMIVIDLGEGMEYPSHPELKIEGTWSVDKMRTEIARLRGMGLEVIPKLNFSTTHNGWMKDWGHMVSSKPYHRMCEDLIRDTMEIFDNPRFFHIGFDEELCIHQEQWSKYQYICVRRGEFWWQDFLHIVRTVEKAGARPWAWSDFGWHNEEYFSRCPKSVIQQNWYYDESYGGFDLATNKTSDRERLQEYWSLEKAGFDQVPCGTNWVGWKRKKEGVGADDVIGKLVKLGREVIAPERLKGFMMAPWAPFDNEENLAFANRGVDLFAEALKS